MMRLILGSDDGTKINLYKDGCILLDGYYPETTNLDAHVTESIDVRINGTFATIQAKLRDLNRMLVYASENKIGPLGVWLEFAYNDADALWRSRVYGGLIDYDGKMSYYLKRSQLKIGLIIERDGYWEGPEAQIPLTNGNGTDNTAGLNVFNCNDGTGTSPNKKNNYVEIGAASVSGDLPAPVRLEMTNNYNSSGRLYDLWLSHNYYSYPAIFQNILEAENADYGGTPYVATVLSGGKGSTFTWAGDTQVNIARWVLNKDYLNRANKRWFKIIALFDGSVIPGMRLQCKITFPSGTPLTVVSTSQEIVATGRNIQEIGEMQIPPWLLSSGDLSAVDLSLYAKKTGGGSFSLDFLQITPVDAFRILRPRGYGAAYTIRVVDDGIGDQIWTDGWGDGGKTGHYTSIGNRVELMPGKLQRIYFLMVSDTGGTTINRTIKVKAFYRPRRLGL